MKHLFAACAMLCLSCSALVSESYKVPAGNEAKPGGFMNMAS